MNYRIVICLIVLCFCFNFLKAQHIAITFEEAMTKGISVEELEAQYKSAAHVDSTKAVFKSGDEQGKVGESYMKMMKDFGKFLTKNNFEWKEITKCYNRIYFNSDGSVDYFIYQFLPGRNQLPVNLTQEEQERFNQLITEYIKDYKFPMKANEKFAVCSPVNYMPLKERED